MSRREAAFTAVAALALATLAALPVFESFGNWGIQDWDQHLFYNAVPRVTLLQYHQVPLWNPYYCGGTVLLAHPLSRFLSPFFILHLLFGTVAGIKLEIPLHLALGLIGVYSLARTYPLGRASSSLAAILYTLSTMFAGMLTTGMTSFLAVAYVPWTLLFARRGLATPRNLLPCAIVLTLTFFEGGAQPLAITLLCLMLHQGFTAARERRIKPLLAFPAVVALMLLLGAVKFAPSVVFMTSHPRPINDYSGYSLTSLAYSLLVRDQSVEAPAFGDQQPGFMTGFSYQADENGMYAGLLALTLFLIGLARAGSREWPLTLLLAIFLWLSFGNRVRPSLWEALHSAPLFHTMRVAQRFRWVTLLAFSLFAAFGLEQVRAFVRRRGGSSRFIGAMSVAIVFAIAVDLVVTGHRVWRQAFPIAPLVTVRRGEFSQASSRPLYDRDGPVVGLHAHGAWSAHYPALLSNEGLIACYETANVRRAAVPRDSPEYLGEAFLLGTTGALTVRRWTPNRLEFEVRVTGPGFIVVNQNYDPGWHASGSGRVTQRSGRLAIAVTPQDRELSLTYRPASFTVGASVSALTWLLLAAVWRMRV